MLIVGCGYIGQRLATRLQQTDQPVSGIVRSTESARQLEQLGIRALVADLDSDRLAALPPDSEQLFYLVPPPAEGSKDSRMEHFLQALRSNGPPGRIVYISTTGVYGDCHGEWVDEQHPPNPRVDRARRRWDAEQQLRDWQGETGGELVILRVAGIYGPGRLPLARLRKGLPMVSEAEAPWTNRIHADDLVQTCMAAMARGRNGEVYNATDGHPGNMADYFNQVADQAGLPRPPGIRLAEAEGRLSQGLLSYLRESRRISNRKILDELGVTLAYPTLKEGLASCFEEEGKPA